ncbi:hypothetical protein PFUGPA_00531 [Plasmodium falciparum Palo Alto/Uganda]|uniref:Uncharacterized protein n=1 Tax=Plasmodium falciparum (isolate Palo Alto / Uganda) TaxID=57270 RepID=W4J7A6_PLAFP|nr:hypothetical protein PFUGPA_00531 [Plasmodium falciparum Palo Alto/Uganda]
MFSLVFCPFVHAKECNFARINKNCLINNEHYEQIAKTKKKRKKKKKKKKKNIYIYII